MAKTKKNKAWVVAVDMGYGHQRPAHSLNHLAETNKVLTANSYPGIPEKDRDLWHKSRSFYEFISRFKRVPIIGGKVFDLYNRLQAIPQFYPRRDLSKSNIQVNQIYRLIKKGWGKHLIEKLSKNPLPYVTTFFVTAFMAEEHKYPGDIFVVVTDTDITRAWVAKNPSMSNIKYLAPTHRVAERLKLYGVPPKNIFFTGFPLPKSSLGARGLSVLKGDMVKRLQKLDPQNKYCSRYGKVFEDHIGKKLLKPDPSKAPTIMFAVGGAGAQREIGATIIRSLKNKILTKKIKVILVAGIHNDVSKFFKDAATKNGLSKEIGKGVEIIYSNSKQDYFSKFNDALRKTDILWTKPSELSFYCALGIPVIMSPSIGSQEDFNRKWLLALGAGFNQEDPEYTNEWLFDWLDSGWFAEAAMEGFIEAPKLGVENIEKIISGKEKQAKKPRMPIQY